MPGERGAPTRPVRVAVIDSGIDAAALGRPSPELTARRFAVARHDGQRGEFRRDAGGSSGPQAIGGHVVTAASAPPGLAVCALPPVPDRLGHGTDVARLILAAAPQAALIDAQVFADGRPVSAAAVAAAIDWAVGQGAELINLSLGLREDHWALRHACAAASAAGVLLVASSPARGGAVYPAAYPGVLAVTGDARCADGEWSLLDGPGAARGDVAGAQVGACPDGLPSLCGVSGRGANLPDRASTCPAGLASTPAPATGRSPRGGASYAAARVCGLAARWCQSQLPALASPGLAARLIDHLAAGAAYRGRERHYPEHAA